MFTPSLATGWFINGDVIGPRDHLEFQSGIMFSRRFDNGLRLGLAGLHISNGGLEHPNNGTEAVLLTLQMPLQKQGNRGRSPIFVEIGERPLFFLTLLRAP